MDRQPAGSSGSTAATTTTAPAAAPAVNTPPAGAAGAAPSPASNPADTGKSAADAFGEAFDEVPVGSPGTTATPSSTPTGDGTTTPAPGSTAATTATGKPQGTTEEPPKDIPLPFADELGDAPAQADGANAELDKISIDDLATPDKALKAVNPDGKVTEAEQNKRLSILLGKHSSQVHAARQVMEMIQPMLSVDAQGKPTGIDILKVAEAIGPDALAAACDARGMKLVPKDWGTAEAQLDRDYPADLVTQVLADVEGIKDLSYSEQVEYLKGNPDKLVDLRIAKREREAQQRDRARHSTAIQEREMETAFDELRKTFKGFDQLCQRSAPDKKDSYFDQANAALPPEIGGKVRLTLAADLAQLYRLRDPKVRKDMAAKIYKAAETDLLNKRKLGAPVGGGGVDVASAGSGAAASDRDVWGD